MTRIEPSLPVRRSFRRTTRREAATRLLRKIRSLSLIALTLATVARPSLAQTAEHWPNKPVRIVVAQAAGGSVDIISRLVAQQLASRMAQAFIVENRVGAGGNLAAEHVAKSAPDGYTLFMGAAALAINAWLYRGLPFDAARDFTPIVLVSTTPSLLLISPQLPARDFQGFLALARAQPGGINYASGGTGTSEHLASEMLKAATGLNMVHVAYKGGAPAMNDVMSGQVPMMFTNLQNALPHVQSGRLRALGIATSQRSPALPDLPTFAELGLPDFFVATWNGLLGPAGLPAEIVQRLNTEVNAMLGTADMRSRLAAMSSDVKGGSATDFAAFYDRELKTWGDAVRRSGARSE